MTIRTKVNPKKAYCYYQCSGAHSNRAYALDGRVLRPCGHMQAIRTELLDEAVWARVASFLEDPGSVLKDVEAEEDPTLLRQLALLTKQARSSDDARERTLHAYQRALIDEPTFEREMRRLVDELAQVQEQIEALEEHRRRRAAAASEAEALKRSLAGMVESPDALDFEARRRVLALLVERVVVGHDAEGRVTADIQGHIPLKEAGREPLGKNGAGASDEPPGPKRPPRGGFPRCSPSRNGAPVDDHVPQSAQGGARGRVAHALG